MARYHINEKGEAKPCRAKPGNCRFGGQDGSADHFETLDAARAVAAQKLQESYGAMASMARPLAPAQFAKLSEDVRTALTTFGGVARGSDLPPVGSLDDIVAKWFEGDSTRLKNFRTLMRDKTMGIEAKKAVGTLITRGVAVSTSTHVDRLATDSGNTKFDESEIDLLDEPVSGISLASLQDGTQRAFERHA